MSKPDLRARARARARRRPLVSVITPTWQRPELLMARCVPSVQDQDYPETEHVIVHDGPMDEDAAVIAGRIADGGPWRHPVQFGHLDGHRPGGRIRSRLKAIDMAKGELIGYLDDDDAFRPGHLSVLAQALADSPAAGFAYSQMASHDDAGNVVSVVGQDPPAYCRIGTPMIVHHRAILEHGTWGPERPDEDWQLVERWLNAGIEYVYVPIVSIDVYPSAYRGGG